MTLKDLVVEPRGGTSVVLDMTIKDLVKESKLDTFDVEESHKDTLDPDMSLKDLACDSVGNHRKGVIPFTDLMCELSNNQMVCEKLTEPKNSKGKHPTTTGSLARLYNQRILLGLITYTTEYMNIKNKLLKSTMKTGLENFVVVERVQKKLSL